MSSVFTGVFKGFGVVRINLAEVRVSQGRSDVTRRVLGENQRKYVSHNSVTLGKYFVKNQRITSQLPLRN
jgi:hypothetical protein